MGELHFDETLIVKFYEKHNKEEILTTLAEKLYKAGYVNNGFKAAILKREHEMPTGLFTGHVNVAIPHTETKYVNEDSIIIGILDNPVQFFAMDNPTKPIDVHIVIMLALSEPHGHICLLQKVVNLIQKKDVMMDVIRSDDMNTIFLILKKHLLS